MKIKKIKRIKCGIKNIKGKKFYISAVKALAASLLFFALNFSCAVKAACGFSRSALIETIISASRKYDIQLPFLVAVMRAESGFNIGSLSPKGAVGLMQVMPETGRELALNIKNPLLNIIAGAKYLHYCLKRFDFAPVPALACYNAGPDSVRTIFANSRPSFIIPPYRDTEIYILRVYKYYNYYRKVLRK